jgi:phosphoribosyl 1,2-cyclic phosphodiesterase
VSATDRSSSVFVRIWGTRGSIPTPGPLTRIYGGNTSCYEVRVGDALLICDAGSGIRELGNHLIARFGESPITAHLLLSHTHWDHVQGFPFFAPAYHAKNNIIVYDKSPFEAKSYQRLMAQFASEYFPVSSSDLKAHITWDHLGGGDREVAGVRIQTFDQVHIGGSLAFALSASGVRVVYATDNELDQLIEGTDERGLRRIAQPQVDFVRNADLLIGDGHYTDEEYARHKGWGHASIVTLVDLAVQADVKQLLVTHHDPNRTDDQVDAMIEHARARARDLGASRLTIEAAREGVQIELSAS